MGAWAFVVTRSGRLPALLIACGCVVLLYGFLFSGDYDVDDVTVRGARVGDPREIAAATGVFGESVFELEPDVIAARLAALPYVERVSVETRLPSRVVVSLTERTPVLVWSTGTQTYLVDARGRVLAAGDLPELPHVLGGGFPVAVGDTIDPLQVAAATALGEAFGTDADTIAWSELDGFTVRLPDKRLVIFGEPARLPLKLAVYQEVRTMNLPWSILDVREPDRPYYE